jgi:hypothetical protein
MALPDVVQFETSSEHAEKREIRFRRRRREDF